MTEDERFWSKVQEPFCTHNDCWMWTSGLDDDGYGFFSIGSLRTKKRTVRAHRWAYEFCNGPIPEKQVIDHLCRNRACVNPAHLRPVTSRQNALENSIGVAAANAQKIHCSRCGRELKDLNSYGRRICRYCINKRARHKWSERVRPEKVVKQTCKNGHPFTRHNGKQRICVVCQRERQKRYIQRKKAQLA